MNEAVRQTAHKGRELALASLVTRYSRAVLAGGNVLSLAVLALQSWPSSLLLLLADTTANARLLCGGVKAINLYLNRYELSVELVC